MTAAETTRNSFVTVSNSPGEHLSRLLVLWNFGPLGDVHAARCCSTSDTVDHPRDDRQFGRSRRCALFPLRPPLLQLGSWRQSGSIRSRGSITRSSPPLPLGTPSTSTSRHAPGPYALSRGVNCYQDGCSTFVVMRRSRASADFSQSPSIQNTPKTATCTLPTPISPGPWSSPVSTLSMGLPLSRRNSGFSGSHAPRTITSTTEVNSRLVLIARCM